MKKEYILGMGVAAIILILYLSRKPIITAVKKLMNRDEFINTYKDTVKKASANTGLFPSLFMAQAILESSDNKGVPGNSTLSKVGNNFFGIKADKGWQGNVITLPTREVINGKSVMVNAPFRKYASPLDSFKDRVQFLIKNSRYKNAGVFIAHNPAEQANALQKAGYASDPNYAKVLIGLIDKYNLRTLDT